MFRRYQNSHSMGLFMFRDFFLILSVQFIHYFYYLRGTNISTSSNLLVYEVDLVLNGKLLDDSPME